MAKIATNTKYMIEASIEIKGIIEEKDIAGAIFGQTEGLVETNLRELQNQGKVGRIEIELKKQDNGTSRGAINIPTNLTQEETAIIAASIETIEKVGPCEAKVHISAITDVRIEKQQIIKSRALDLLSKMRSESLNTREFIQDIKDEIKVQKAVKFLGTTAGPDVEKNKDIIIVEGRADVLALLRAGVNNSIAIEGSKIKQEVIDFADGKNITLFVDGDKGGEIIARTISQKIKISFFAKAPDGKEVEELSPKDILLSLQKKHGHRPEASVFDKQHSLKKYNNNLNLRSAFKSKIVGPVKSNTNPILKKYLQELAGTQAIYLLDYRNAVMARVPQTDINEAVSHFGKKINSVLIDGKITPKIVKILQGLEKNIILVGTEKASNLKQPENILIFTENEI
ncbi:MAG: hypothetical protein COW47_01375 [Candidatus Huberarchaeum crystalense]|uniref:Toprim domain-containing protein n=1 Tax=Huberarchaeum crystalense TaxID=2014257 RepID=A0A2G9LJE8_HUBC1|nr:toprim domain-containing protein [archaeon]OIP20662.1 MAG: hypothetical protein AUJ91_00790 [archaeon CG2_30_31_98]PIN66673.1 MAG: hypothetical protein COW69_00885 [Candidatus Huberarchaeum crystalense]NCS98177.1 toprim domain-containing protein [archaeon]PIV13677.1 MAG: hypothetical protein COS45_01585 [Candidatus Huberarchaeum crystalense]